MRWPTSWRVRRTGSKADFSAFFVWDLGDIKVCIESRGFPPFAKNAQDPGLVARFAEEHQALL
jgi:hypothetical protein